MVQLKFLAVQLTDVGLSIQFFRAQVTALVPLSKTTFVLCQEQK